LDEVNEAEGGRGRGMRLEKVLNHATHHRRSDARGPQGTVPSTLSQPESVPGTVEFANMVGQYFPGFDLPRAPRLLPAIRPNRGLALRRRRPGTEEPTVMQPKWIPALRAPTSLIGVRELPVVATSPRTLASRGVMTAQERNRGTVPAVLDLGFLALRRCREILTVNPRGEVPLLPAALLAEIAPKVPEPEPEPEETPDVVEEEEATVKVYRAKDRETGEEVAYATDGKREGEMKAAEKELQRMLNKDGVSPFRYLKYKTMRLRLAGNELSDLSGLPRVLHLGIWKGPASLTQLDLSQNQIARIPDSFAEFTGLMYLNLQSNLIQDFASVEKLRPIGALRYLATQGNPIQLDHSYRWKIISILPQLTRVDASSITKTERKLSMVAPKRLPPARAPETQPLIPDLPKFPELPRGHTPPTPHEMRVLLSPKQKGQGATDEDRDDKDGAEDELPFTAGVTGLTTSS